MALADTAARAKTSTDGPRSPNQLALNLSSNNPFRNRLSTASTSPRAMDSSAQQFPFPTASKNPFLDPAEPATKSPPTSGNNTGQVDDIFKDLSVAENPAFSNGPIPPKGVPVRAGTLPTQSRPPRPDEQRDRPPRGPLRNADSPKKRPDHRRHASETSMAEVDRLERRERQMDRGERPTRTESEERKRRERRREREERHRREQERLKAGGKPRKAQRNLDLIDKLDVTGVYGHGLFHHDGPFDACNPHRNARKDRRAPMQAFPEGSANMALGGSGPNRSRLDLDKFHGRTEEGFTDYSATRKTDTKDKQAERGEPLRYVNPTDRTERVHGEESYGLGTSTFLEGTTAPKSALQRRESEEQAVTFDGNLAGGLQRKKSLAQRIRGMSATRPRGAVDGLRSPEARYPRGPVELSDGPVSQTHSMSAGGPSRAVYTKANEINVFDNEYDTAFEKKGAEIKFAEQEKPNIGRARAPSSPRDDGLTRSVTADAAMASPTEEKPSGGGLLSRMKSLKGSKRVRPERKESYA